MERNREARRGSMAAMNGGLLRRRQRSSGMKDSPEDGGMERQETTRLRDRVAKKDHDRDRSSRIKRRRGETVLDDDDEEEEESLDEEDEDDDDDDEAPVVVGLPPLNPPAAASPPPLHHRKTIRVPPWTGADEIGVAIPKKARSASAKRLHESWISGVGRCGEQFLRQSPSSPSRLSPASAAAAAAAQFSPNFSIPSVHKKMKPLGGTKQRPPKTPKPSSNHEAIEMEIAEVLSRLRKQEDYSHRIDDKDGNGLGNESPNSISPPTITHPALLPSANLSSDAPLTAVAPKRKRPRPVKFEDESLTRPMHLQAQPRMMASSAARIDAGHTPLEENLPKLEKLVPSSGNENCASLFEFSAPQTIPAPCVVFQEPEKLEDNPVPDYAVPAAEPDCRDREKAKTEVSLPQKETTPTALKVTQSTVSLREEKLTIDLMALPLRSSPERDKYLSNDRPVVQDSEPVSKVAGEKNEVEVVGKMVNENAGEGLMEGGKAGKSLEDFDSKKQVMTQGKALDQQFNLADSASDKHELPTQQSKASIVEPQSNKTVPSSLPTPIPVAGWLGSFPPFGYMGQVPSLQSMIPVIDATTGSSSKLQPQNFLPPPVRRRRCSTHCYIAQSIQYNQRIMQMNPFWSASAGTAQMFGAKPPCNLNGMPPSEAILGNPFQGSFPGRSLGSVQDSKGAPIFAAFSGHPAKDKLSSMNTNTESAQRKQLALQQAPPQHGSANNMIPSPALIFPLNHHQAVVAAAAAAAAAARSGAANSTPGAGTVGPPSGVSCSAVPSLGGGGPAVAMNYGYSTEQYLAILQNNGYPFPIPAHVAGPPSYRGGSPAQAVPYFGGPFYASQMLNHSQLHQQQQQAPASVPKQPPHAQPSHQNTSTSSGSSSSQKQQQQLQRVQGGGANGTGPSSHSLPSTKQRPHLQTHQARELEHDRGCEDSPSTADSRVLQAQKSLYGHNLALPIHPQNAALLSTAAAAAGLNSGVGYREKQPTHQQQPGMKPELTPSQAFAMSFASINGGASPSGIDFSSMPQGHAFFQTLPEAARHGYQMTMAAAAAASVQTKKAHPQAIDGWRAVGDSMMNSNKGGEEESKMVMATIKAPGISSLQHSRSFANQDNEAPMSTYLGNSVVDRSSRVPNPTLASGNSGRTSNGSTNATTASTNTSSMAPVSTSNFQQFQLQKHAQELQLQHQIALTRTKSSTSSSHADVYSERVPPSCSTMTKFPQMPTCFPQGVIPAQPPQWKTFRGMGTPIPSSSADLLAARNHLQHQGRPALTPSHQTQISFGAKTAPAGAQPLPGNASASSTAAATAAVAIGSPSNSVSKSTDGSPRASANAKPTSPANTPALERQSYTKNSASSSSQKSSPNRNTPSNLGHPQHTNPVTNSSNSRKPLPQSQQYRLQPQPHMQKQPHLFFSNAAYTQAQGPQSNATAAAAAASYYRRQSEQQQLSSQQQQHQTQTSSNPVSSGTLTPSSSDLTLAGGSSTASDNPAKAGAATANSTKGLPPQTLLHAAQIAAATQSSASVNAHPLMSAMFPYMSMPPMSAKPGDQKPTAGNDLLHASWQPEKRS